MARNLKYARAEGALVACEEDVRAPREHERVLSCFGKDKAIFSNDDNTCLIRDASVE